MIHRIKIFGNDMQLRTQKQDYFVFQYRDNSNNFRFESAYSFNDIEQGLKQHQLVSLSSYYRKRRCKYNLSHIHAIVIDIDGNGNSFPLSHLDIIEGWDEFGFEKPPTQIIRTSEGRFHIVISIVPVKAIAENISFWKKVSLGLYKIFEDMGADKAATTNPVGLIRIPGHINFKYPVKPIVESVFETDSVFTLSEIYNKLVENEIFTKADKTYSTSVNENIKLLERGVQERFRNNACFTLAIYYNNKYELSEEECLDKLITWNLNNNPPLALTDIKSSVSSAYRNGYKISKWWINNLAANISRTIESGHTKLKVTTLIPKRVPVQVHANKISQYICDNGGNIELSISQLVKLLNIPKSSFFEAIKLIPELNIKPINKGRNAKSAFSLKTKLKLAN